MRHFAGPLIGAEGPGAWLFVQVPDDLAPPATHGWGRTPVRATVNAITWDTSVWRGKDGRSLLPVPRKVRGAALKGDVVEVAFEPR